jgi:rfaE bifunctional protein nucleotidyltransferase chain/domain
MSKKILNLTDLGSVINKHKKELNRIVLCHGVFDLVHLGHIRYFNAAKKNGDILVVTLTSDAFCRKGPDRPVFSEDLRAESLSAIEIIDYIAICPYPSAIEAIKIIKPNFYAKGKEYEIENNDVTGMIAKEISAVEEFDGQVIFTDELVFSSSNLLNQNFDLFSSEVKEYINDFKSKYELNEIIKSIENIEQSKVLVIGEAIIDRYTYADPLGQTGKGSHFSVRKRYSEDYPGGSIAVANHIASFIKNVTLFSGLGNIKEIENYENYIHSNLHPNVLSHFIRFKEARTIVKERFVDNEMNKFFEVYHSKDGQCPTEQESQESVDWLELNLEKFDIVVVPDYGNGFITDLMSEVISRKSKFLALNTQINSGNRGYHVVNRYNSANFISLNEPELRLASHNKVDSIAELSKETSKLLNAEYISVTQGPLGLYTYCSNANKSFRVPALSSTVIDRVGAGDAFLSISAISLGSKLNAEVSIFLGAVAAAMDVQIKGNESTINNADLIKYISALLK